MTRPTLARPQSQLSAWQEEALAELKGIADRHSDVITMVTAAPVVTATHAFVTIRLPTKELPTGPRGLRFRDLEDFIIGIGRSRISPPQIDVEHQRFAGYPHVLQGHRLCIYLDPSREWNPQAGMAGLLERLWAWLGDAAAGRFDAATAMYHAVGGVLHLSDGTPTVVIRDPVPDKPIQRARIQVRTAHRMDMTFASALAVGLVMPVLRLPRDLPFGAGLTLAQLLDLIDDSSGSGLLGRGGSLPMPSQALLTSLIASSLRNADGTHQYFTLAVPNPAGGPVHLLVGRLPAAASDELRRLTPQGDLGLSQIGKEVPVEWCRVSDERPEVTTRRDDSRPVNAFQGKSVFIWGCGGIGSWVAEFISRAGAARVSLCDDAIVTGGLLVRQDYVEADIGRGKALALAARIRSISDRVEVATVTPPADDLDRVITSADVVIDATVSIAVAQALAAVAATEQPHAVLAQLATDSATGTLGVLTVSAAGNAHGPAVIDTNAGLAVLADPALELYHSFWREPLAGHELIPTLGCSAPTFHGSAADLAAVAACLTNLLALHLTTSASGTHLIALPHAAGSGSGHHFIPA